MESVEAGDDVDIQADTRLCEFKLPCERQAFPRPSPPQL